MSLRLPVGKALARTVVKSWRFFWSRKDVRRLLVGVRCKALVDLRFFIHCLNHYFFPLLLLLTKRQCDMYMYSLSLTYQYIYIFTSIANVFAV